MSLPPLAMSESKAAVLQRLGLTGEYGERIYKMLLDEASAGRDRLSHDRGNLPQHSQQNHMIKPPFKWDELSETMRHREILSIAASAGYYTKSYYDKGNYRSGPVDENWVARWFLWHAFRYRDNRPREAAAAATSSSCPNPGNAGAQAPYYDPVYGQYRSH